LARGNGRPSADVFSDYACGKLDADTIQYLAHVDLRVKIEQGALSNLSINPGCV